MLRQLTALSEHDFGDTVDSTTNELFGALEVVRHGDLPLIWVPSISAGIVRPFVASECMSDVLSEIEDAKGNAETMGALFCLPFLYITKGDYLLATQPPSPEEAERNYLAAIELARRQAAKSGELRAATALARLWESQGRLKEAYDLLSPVYEWFTEGFDTADLKEAKALLEALK